LVRQVGCQTKTGRRILTVHHDKIGVVFFDKLLEPDKQGSASRLPYHITQDESRDCISQWKIR